MSEATDIYAGHPLWLELRNGMLWHRTGVREYWQICADRFIKPNDGRVNRWGGQYACQQLGGLSLFDFTTQPESKVLGEVIKWRQFLGDVGPVTVLLGLDRSRLVGRLIPYPNNKEGMTGNVIPWVEVCHCGPIPISAVVSYLLVCSIDYNRFSPHKELNKQTLARAESEFGNIVRVAREQGAKKTTQMNEKIHAVTQSPEFKTRMEQTMRRVEESGGRK